MANTEHFIGSSDIHPIDIVETLAEQHDWDFDRVGDDQIAMVVEGTWRSYSITLAWSEFDETLRMICTFDMDPPANRMPELYELLNLTNDKIWTGAFSYWTDQKLMVYRYGLLLTDGTMAETGQIDQVLSRAVKACERFYPAFQLTSWGNEPPAEAIEVAMAEAYGRA